MDTIIHYHFIVNEYSTNGDKAAQKVTKKMNLLNKPFTIYRTDKPKSAVNIITNNKSKIKKEDIVVAVGGDGTLSEVVNGVLLNNLDNAIAFVPTGKGNDFAREHKMPTSIGNSIDHLIYSAKKTKLDVIQITDENNIHYAVNSIGFGIDGTVIQMANRKDKNRFSYIFNLFSALFKQKLFSFDITYNNKTIHTEKNAIILFLNSGYFGGGLHIIPENNNTDGLLDILYTKELNTRVLFKLVWILLTNNNHLSHPNVIHERTKKAHLTLNDQQAGQADGEVLGTKMFDITVEALQKNFYI